jgi:type IV pilus assembly protein PilC
MSDLEQNKQDFATSGTESFSLGAAPGTKIGPNDKIVLNIREDRKNVVLDRTKGHFEFAKGILATDLFSKANNYFIAHSKVNDNTKSNFFHLLSVMINAGIPMVTALRSLAQQESHNPKMMMVILELVSRVEAGKSLSEAMLIYGDVFTEKDIGMVKSGEASGQLSNALENLANDTMKAYEIKSKIKSAMMYPIVVMLLLIGVFVAMMIFVIPKLTELFTSYNQNLPTLTKIVIGISDFMINDKYLLIGIVAALVFSFVIFKKTDYGKYFIDLFKLKVPLFGKLFQKAYLSRFARSLSNLLNSGLSIVGTLEIVANSVGNEVYRKKLLIAMEDIKQGIPLAESLAESDFFPPMLLSMIDVGEKTAQLDTILAKVATFYEDEVATSVSGLSKILEPVILVVIGLSVGLVVGAIMIPIMKMSDLTSVM